MRVGSSDNNVSSDCGVNNLTGYILIAETNYKAILVGVILVLVLPSKAETCPVVGLPCIEIRLSENIRIIIISN
jgi:hypothetical protein